MPASEQDAKLLDDLLRYFGKICESTFFDASALAIGFTKQYRRKRITIGYGIDIHGYVYIKYKR